MDPASLEPPRKQGFLSALLQPLRDFGLGATSLRQATNGLFVIAGISESARMGCGRPWHGGQGQPGREGCMGSLPVSTSGVEVAQAGCISQGWLLGPPFILASCISLCLSSPPPPPRRPHTPGMAFMLASWAKGNNMGRRGQSYQAILEFPVACGISVGTPVRIRGVPVGGVLGVQPSLEKVEVLVEIRDSTTVIPRNSLIEANQSGLIAEPLIDITPQLPLPEYKGGLLCEGGGRGGTGGWLAWYQGTCTLGRSAGPRQPPLACPPRCSGNPLDDSCEEEGKVVCHQGRIRGERGVSGE